MPNSSCDIVEASTPPVKCITRLVILTILISGYKNIDHTVIPNFKAECFFIICIICRIAMPWFRNDDIVEKSNLIGSLCFFLKLYSRNLLKFLICFFKNRRMELSNYLLYILKRVVVFVIKRSIDIKNTIVIIYLS